MESLNIMIHIVRTVSQDVIKKSFNKRKIYLENGVSVIIKVKRYLCKKCRKYSQVRFNGIYEDYCNFSNRIKNKAINIRTRGWDSLRNLTWTLNVCNSIKMSYETIRQSLLIHDGLYFLMKILNHLVMSHMTYNGLESIKYGIIDMYYLI